MSHSQVLLTGYVQIFHALFPHLKSGFLREDVESLGKVLMSCAQVPLGQLGCGVFRLISDFLFCFSIEFNTFNGFFCCRYFFYVIFQVTQNIFRNRFLNYIYYDFFLCSVILLPNMKFLVPDYQNYQNITYLWKI